MKWNKTLLIIAFSLVVVLLFSCSADSSSPSFRVIYLSPDGKVAMIHKVEAGEMDVPPQEGELPENEEFYWSLTKDGDIFDFNTPITGNITLYPIAKSKRVNVEFHYSDGTILTSKLCKVGAKVSVSDLGFSDKIYVLSELTDIISSENVLDTKLSYNADGYKFQFKITSTLLEMTASGAVKGTEALRAMKGSYTLDIPRILDGDTVLGIEKGAFSSNEGEKAYSFNKLILPDTLSSIEEKAFMNCKSLTEVSVNSVVTEIRDYVFSVCSSLKSIIIPDGVTSIGKEAFKSCSALSEISIPGSVKTIGEGAFEGCSNLGKVTLSKGLESIEDKAFASCIKIPTVLIPSTISYIGYDAFYDCAIMTEIIIDKEDYMDVPAAMPWGAYEFYDKALKARNCKPFVFTLKNLQGEEIFIYNPK